MQNDLDLDIDRLITEHTPKDDGSIARVRARLFGSETPGSVNRVRQRLFGTPAPLVPPRYEARGFIGKGAFGEVVQAFDQELGRTVALKIFHLDDVEQLARIRREAEALAQIDHPNVVKVYECGAFGTGAYYISLEHVIGARLDTWLDRKVRTLREILEVFLQTANGLRAVHDRGLIHRDFKPANVVVGDDGRVRVLDFGLAKRVTRESDELQELTGTTDAPPTLADTEFDATSTDRCEPADPGVTWGPSAATQSCSALPDPFRAIQGRGDRQRCAQLHLDMSLSRHGNIVGTPLYSSPEQLTGAQADLRSDIFSFCVALFEAVYGFRPFAGKSRVELANHISEGRLHDLEPARRVPRWLKRLLLRGLSPLPQQRPADFGEVIEILARKLAPRWPKIATVAASALATASLVFLALALRPPAVTLDQEWSSSHGARLGLDLVYGEGLERALDDYEQQWLRLGRTLVVEESDPDILDCLRGLQSSFDAFVVALREGRPTPSLDRVPISMTPNRLWMSDLPVARCQSMPHEVTIDGRTKARNALLSSQVLQLKGDYENALDEADDAWRSLPQEDLSRLAGSIHFQRAYLKLQQLAPDAEDALEWAKLSSGNDPEFAVDILTMEALIDCHLGEGPPSPRDDARALRLLEGLGGRRPISWAWYHFSAGQRSMDSNRREAERHFRYASRNFWEAGDDAMVATSDLQAAYALSAIPGQETRAADLSLDALNRLIGSLGVDHPSLPRRVVDVVQILGIASSVSEEYGELLRPLLEGVVRRRSDDRTELERVRATADLLLLDVWKAWPDHVASSPFYQRSQELEQGMRKYLDRPRRDDLARIAEAIATARFVADERGARPETRAAIEQWLHLEDDQSSWDQAMAFLQELGPSSDER